MPTYHLKKGAGGHLCKADGHLVRDCIAITDVCCKIGNCCFGANSKALLDVVITAAGSYGDTCCDPSYTYTKELLFVGCGGGLATYQSLDGLAVALFDGIDWGVSYPGKAVCGHGAHCTDCDPRTDPEVTTTESDCCGLSRSTRTTCLDGTKAIVKLETVTVFDNHCCRNTDTGLCENRDSSNCVTGSCPV